MRILWVTPWFGNYRVAVYDELNKACGGNFYLICSHKDTSNYVRQRLKATLGGNVTILSGDGNISFGNQSSDFANKGIVIKRQKGLYKSICAVNPDVVIVEGFGGWAPAGIRYGALHRKPVLIFYERTAYVERNSPWWRTLYRKTVGRFASGFIINGSLTRQYLGTLGFGSYPMTEGCMVADSKGLSEAVAAMGEQQKQQLRKSLQLCDGGLAYLFVGQMVERKGIAQLLAAWTRHVRQYPHDTIIVIGDGVMRQQLQAQYANEQSIKILGGIGYEHIHQYYAIADVFVMPTLEDNWSLVVPEAMACQLPVATTPYNGCFVELIDNGQNGYLFDSLNSDDTVAMLGRFHSANLDAMGRKSLEIASHYTPAIASAKILELCKQTYR